MKKRKKNRRLLGVVGKHSPRPASTDQPPATVIHLSGAAGATVIGAMLGQMMLRAMDRALAAKAAEVANSPQDQAN